MVVKQKTVESDPLFLSNHEQIVQGEITLWRAVIAKALSDLRLPNSNKKYCLWRKQAENWFSANDKDFFEVCQLANLPTSHILGIANRIIANNKRLSKNS